MFRADFVQASGKAKPRAARLVALRKRLVLPQDRAEYLARHLADCWLPRAGRDFQNWDLRLMLAAACQTPKAQAKLPVPVVTRRALLLPLEPLLDWPAPVSSMPDHE